MYRLRNSLDSCATIAARMAGSSAADVADDALGAEVCARVGAAIMATSKDATNALSPRFAVTIEDARGRRSTTEYAGVPGRRPKVMDALGRLRPQPSIG